MSSTFFPLSSAHDDPFNCFGVTKRVEFQPKIFIHPRKNTFAVLSRQLHTVGMAPRDSREEREGKVVTEKKLRFFTQRVLIFGPFYHRLENGWT